jgi:hypothetical protein
VGDAVTLDETITLLNCAKHKYLHADGMLCDGYRQALEGLLENGLIVKDEDPVGTSYVLTPSGQHVVDCIMECVK